jgi:hypothetical protein
MLLLLLYLIVIGAILWLVESQIPMAEPIKLVVRVIIVIFAIYLLLGAVGFVDAPLPKLR